MSLGYHRDPWVTFLIAAALVAWFIVALVAGSIILD